MKCLINECVHHYGHPPNLWNVSRNNSYFLCETCRSANYIVNFRFDEFRDGLIRVIRRSIVWADLAQIWMAFESYRCSTPTDAHILNYTRIGFYFGGYLSLYFYSILGCLEMYNEIMFRLREFAALKFSKKRMKTRVFF